MEHNYFAFDLGASSGRAILGRLSAENRLTTEIVHRFSNQTIPVGQNLQWNAIGLYNEMLTGMRLCSDKYTRDLQSMAVDTWGVDFALIDAQGTMLGEPVAYRDKRTTGMMDLLFSRQGAADVYGRTGIQFAPFNTIFQLLALKEQQSPQLDCAQKLLFMPDLFNYLFSGVAKSEFTFATTSQLYNPVKKEWDQTLFDSIKVDRSIMQEIVQPGTIIGNLTDILSNETGLDHTPVAAVASHDTGSAVAAMPASDDRSVYISSGTWSLMGIESKTPIISAASYKANFTNEGGVCGTFRFLKNIMGLWLVQECKRIWSRQTSYSYDELTAMAHQARPHVCVIDPDHASFLSPSNMIDAINEFCTNTDQPQPATPGEYIRTILESLALDYKYTLGQITSLSGRTIEKINIIGGGSQNMLLNQLTADCTGLPVHAGPVEATAIGNLLVQAMAHGRIKSIDELRSIVRHSFDITIISPTATNATTEKAYQKFITLK